MNRPASRPTSIPRFIEGLDFMRADHPRYPYKILHDAVIYFPPVKPIMPRNCGLSCEQKRIVWGAVRPHSITVKAGYAWNGNTCWLDTPRTMLASLVHDLIYQFSGCADWPKHLDRKWADDLYYSLASGFFKYTNRLGLAMFSGMCWAREPEAGETVETFASIEPT